MFEDPNVIKYIGTPVWRTRVGNGDTVEREQGQADPEKADGALSEGQHRHVEDAARHPDSARESDERTTPAEQEAKAAV